PLTPNQPYAPQIVPANFVPGTANPYFPLAPSTYWYRTEDGSELNQVMVTSGTKTILGVVTIVVHDRVYVDENENGVADGTSCGADPGFTSELIEETFDWYAPDNTGAVWYFGEDSKEYDHCTLVGTAGSWEAGLSGAQPGIIMLANPVIGQMYRQEFLADIAEDWAKVVSLTQAVSVPFGDFEGCVETMEWTPLEPGHRADKYYCGGVGLVLEVTPSVGRERNELISRTP
ncbi:MAG TPA: hypothetical protein VGQ24_02440, partial [Gemmatimonadales bacterium]|nr:hypothetical protein [Gemmatimonadales bacterium]